MLRRETGGAPPALTAPQRIQFKTKVCYRSDQKTKHYGESVDISIGGLYLETNVPIAVGETVMLAFSLPGPEPVKTLSCKAKVAWTNLDRERRKPAFPTGVGLQFVDLLQEDFRTIARFIDRQDDHPKMTVTCAWCNDRLGYRTGPAGQTSHGICEQCFNKLKRFN